MRRYRHHLGQEGKDNNSRDRFWKGLGGLWQDAQ